MKRIRLKYIFIGFLLVLILGGVIRVAPWKISQIDVNLDNADCVNSNQITNLLQSKNNLPFIFWSQSIREKITHLYPCLKTVVLIWEFPNKLQVIGSSRKAIAKVGTFDNTIDKLRLQLIESSPSSQAAILSWQVATPSAQTYLVDDQGVVFSPDDGSNIPQIYIQPQRLAVGTHLNSKLFMAIGQVFHFLSKIDIGNNLTGKIIGHDLLLSGNIQVALSLDKDILRQVASLQLILEKAKIDSKRIKRVDLRFNKPVVEY